MEVEACISSSSAAGQELLRSPQEPEVISVVLLNSHRGAERSDIITSQTFILYLMWMEKKKKVKRSRS